MSSFIYNYGKEAILERDLSAATIKAKLVMSNSTCPTEPDVDDKDNFTTLDECNATGYTEQTLAGQAVTVDTVNNRGELDANDVNFGNLLNDATRDIIGVLLYIDAGAGVEIPLAYIEFPYSVAPDGGAYTVQWDAQGIIHLV